MDQRVTDSPTLKAILRAWDGADHGVRRSMACELAIETLDATGKHGVEVLRHMLRMVLGRPDADLHGALVALINHQRDTPSMPTGELSHGAALLHLARAASNPWWGDAFRDALERLGDAAVAADTAATPDAAREQCYRRLRQLVR